MSKFLVQVSRCRRSPSVDERGESSRFEETEAGTTIKKGSFGVAASTMIALHGITETKDSILDSFH